ncbi:hypothetical protein I6N96_00990 [Enterococcus sp. BWM-S5]|uniref:Phage protein n=1 Tax=Enterococcus larvae TaxID=2794352 RepID=A0ABS4CEC7_9ENTE|nr:hypothetical protein [Enterococcus larvae]MBP1044837.1 hypothetical protein [Enterococcus larvae]
MENWMSWITPTLLATVITGFLTYKGTKQTSRASIDELYLPRVEKMMTEFEEKVDKLNKKVAELERKLNAKDELIIELRKEISRLERENTELRGEDTNG